MELSELAESPKVSQEKNYEPICRSWSVAFNTWPKESPCVIAGQPIHRPPCARSHSILLSALMLENARRISLIATDDDEAGQLCRPFERSDAGSSASQKFNTWVFQMIDGAAQKWRKAAGPGGR